MMTLDDRARRAAQAIHASTDEYTPAAAFPVVVRHRRWVQIAQGAAAFAALIAFIAIGAFLRPAPEPDVSEETPDPIVEEIEETVPDIDDPLPEADEVPDTKDPSPAPIDEEPVGGVPVNPDPVVEEPADTTPPALAITAPTDGATFKETSIWFSGTTEPGATVAAGRWEADVDVDGTWSIRLILSNGANRATFTATDAAGNTATASVVVYYEAPPPPKDDGGDEKPPKDVEFTAYQVYGECTETPAYDVFWGTAKPGSTITIESEYGSGTAAVNGEGDWEVKVFFADAPYGKVFSVKVMDQLGSKKIFEFVRLEA